jgi:hypothetical protein
MESHGDAELRQRRREVMRHANEALSDGGECKVAMLDLARKWKKRLRESVRGTKDELVEL